MLQNDNISRGVKQSSHYHTAELSSELVGKVKEFEEQLKKESGKEVVLIAYEDTTKQ